jgi:hypothetical protein
VKRVTREDPGNISPDIYWGTVEDTWWLNRTYQGIGPRLWQYVAIHFTVTLHWILSTTLQIKTDIIIHASGIAAIEEKDRRAGSNAPHPQSAIHQANFLPNKTNKNNTTTATTNKNGHWNGLGESTFGDDDPQQQGWHHDAREVLQGGDDAGRTTPRDLPHASHMAETCTY